MRKGIALLACSIALRLAAGVGVLAQNAPSAFAQSAQAAPASGYSIAGTVVNAVTAEPVRWATVAVLSEADNHTVASVETDNEGRFALEGLAAAKYPLTASKRGFLTAFYDQHDEGYNTAIVTGADQETGNLIFRLSPGAALHGVVTGDGGDPVEGAKAMLFLKPHNHNPGARIIEAGEAVTDDTGAYEFDDLAAGAYFLGVKAEPWYALHPSTSGQRQRPESDLTAALDVAYQVTFFDSTTDESSATSIVLTGGSREEADINLRAVPALHILVQVPQEHQELHELSSPPGLKQTIFGTQIPSETLLNRNPTASDVAEFTGVAPGHYELTQGDPPRIVELDATTCQQVDPALGIPTVTVSGSLRAISGFALPENLSVILSPIDSTQGQAPLQANGARGSFTFDVVPTGVWKLTTLSPGKTLSVSSIISDGRVQTGNLLMVRDKPVQIEATVSVGETRVEGFARNSEVPGARSTVIGVDKNNKGVPGVMVVLVPRNPVVHGDLFRRDQSDSDGSFSLLDVAPGEYTVVAIEDGWELDWARPEVIGRYLAKGIAVTVKESSGKHLRLSEGVPVQAR